MQCSRMSMNVRRQAPRCCEGRNFSSRPLCTDVCLSIGSDLVKRDAPWNFPVLIGKRKPSSTHHSDSVLCERNESARRCSNEDSVYCNGQWRCSNESKRSRATKPQKKATAYCDICRACASQAWQGPTVMEMYQRQARMGKIGRVPRGR
jgi:hypothetical protein